MSFWALVRVAAFGQPVTVILVFCLTTAPFWAVIVVGMSRGARAEVAVGGQDRVGALREGRFEGFDRLVGDRFEFRVGDLAFDVGAPYQVDADAIALEHEDHVGEGRPAVGDQDGGTAQRPGQERRCGRGLADDGSFRAGGGVVR